MDEKELDKKLEEEAAREELYRELEKGIKSLEEGKGFTEEEVYKALEKI